MAGGAAEQFNNSPFGEGGAPAESDSRSRASRINTNSKKYDSSRAIHDSRGVRTGQHEEAGGGSLVRWYAQGSG